VQAVNTDEQDVAAALVTRPELGAPAAAQALPVVGGDPERGAHQLEPVRAVVRRLVMFNNQASDRALSLEPRVHLVPFDLVGDQRRDHVVDVGRAGHVHGQRVGAIVVPLSAARGCLDRLPLVNPGAECPGEMFRQLAEHDAVHGAGDRWQPIDGINERARVDGRAGRPGVEAGVHVAVSRLEGAQPDLARGAQDRAVGTHVQLDLVAAGGRSLGCPRCFLAFGTLHLSGGRASGGDLGSAHGRPPTIGGSVYRRRPHY
jgi:hypothetical protein